MSQPTALTDALIRQLPKVELHCHLDGSISLPAIRQMAAVTKTPLPEDDAALRELVTAPLSTTSLIDYLRRFQVVTDLMQTREQLLIAGEDMVHTAADDGVIYMETRFAPAIFTEQGLSVEEAIDAVLTGLRQGTAKYGVPVNAIVCAMRDRPLEESARVFLTAAKFKGQGVVGLDFAGDEYHHPTSDLVTAMEVGLTTGLPFTLHAGEAGPAENVADALLLGAKRIGHGTHMSGHPDIIALAKEKHATIETCLTSNIQTKAVSGYESFPIAEFLSAGLNVTVNTDDRTVSDVDLTHEFLALHEHYGMDLGLMQQVTLNAVNGAFIPAGEKARLSHQVTEGFQSVIHNG